ncbi:MAG: F0F1 ATP synthase subunit gamma [Crocosphaera sp.]|nr:F0F1 ATP synthase subunit gamma [Crocosphaera sp.]
MSQTPESLKATLDSVEDLYSVVKTMKALAAVSIRQYEQAVQSLVEYDRTVEMGFHILAKERYFAGKSLVLTIKEQNNLPDPKIGAIILGSDQGLCGQFNENMAKYAKNKLQPSSKPKNLFLAIVGSRLLPYFRTNSYQLANPFMLPTSTEGIGETVQDILLMLDNWQEKHKISKILLFYNQPTSGSSYHSCYQQLLPLDRQWLLSLERKDWPTATLPTFTMDWQDLFRELISQYLFVSLYRALAASLASENASRLAAMQSAQKNIEDHLEELKAQYRRQRQSAITSELLDVVAGFEALT